MSDARSVEQLGAENAVLRAEVAQLRVENAKIGELMAVIARLTERIAELERALAADSSNSSPPPSSDAPWAKKPATKRSSRTRSGRKPGGQPGASGSSRSLIENPDDRLVIAPDRCHRCDASVAGAAEEGRQRRQVIEVSPVPPPTVTEYQRISKICGCCGAVTTPSGEDDAVPAEHAQTTSPPGSPMRIGPETCARAALLACAHHLPVGRSRDLLEALCAMDVCTGFLAGIRARAARPLEKTFLAPQADTAGQRPAAARRGDTRPRRGCLVVGACGVHVACTEYLTLIHVGDPSAATIDAGGVLAEFTGVLVRDGYAGYQHLQAVPAWCGAHLLRDLHSISDADPEGQLWAIAMATTLLDTHRGAQQARERGAERLDAATLTQIRNHYRGALARGDTDNRGEHTTLATTARTLINRFRRYEDMILRFTTNLSVPFTNNEAERSCRPLKVQQRTSGGAWPTLQSLTDFATVGSYLDTATKWGLDKLDALRQLFTTGAWLPPALTPTE